MVEKRLHTTAGIDLELELDLQHTEDQEKGSTVLSRLSSLLPLALAT